MAAADPRAAVARSLRLQDWQLTAGGKTFDVSPPARVFLIAFGKAAPGMVRAALDVLGPRVNAGIVVYPKGADPGGPWPPALHLFAASHPVPDEQSLAAGEAALSLLREIRAEDLVLVLISGGGSSLFEALRPGISLGDVQSLTLALQHAGADIVELNTVRRALSRVKGGGLARAVAPARLVTLVLSDVIGDPLDAIASGPTVPPTTSVADAGAVLERRGLAKSYSHVTSALFTGDASPAYDAAIAIVGSNRMAATAVCAEAERRGFETLMLTDRMRGEARVVGRRIGALARVLRDGGRLPPPFCLVLGGETTVTVRGDGTGGRNLELVLGAAKAIEHCPDLVVCSFATDGLDGSSGAAGAVATGETLARAKALGLSAEAAFARNDTAPFFAALGDLWVTGPSGTNVNDLTVVLAYQKSIRLSR